MSRKSPEGFVDDLFSWMGRTLKALFNKAEPVLMTTIRQFFDKFETIAVEAVAEQATKALSGQEKFTNAVANVAEKVAAEGWQASQTILQTLVQDAYTAWKASQKPVPGELLVKAPQ